VVVYLAVQLAVIIVARVVEKAVGALKLTGVNRILGGAAGAFKAALVLSVTFLVLGRFGIPGESTQDNSSLYGPIAAVLPASWDYVASAMPEVKKISERFGVEVEDRLAEDQVDEVIDRVKEEVTEEHEEKPREQ
jgi:membrane protein required for colicin V production